MQTSQLAIGNAQARRRHVTDERFDRGKVHDGFGLDERPETRAQQAAEEGAATGIHPDHLPAAVDLGQLNFVPRNQAAVHQIDEVARHEVFAQQNLARTALEASQVDPVALERDPALGQATDFANRHEQVATLNAHHRADEWRVGVVAETRDQVLDAAHSVTVLIKDRAPKKRGKVANSGHRGFLPRSLPLAPTGLF